MKGVIASVGLMKYSPKHGDHYDIHCGVIRGEDGQEYRYTASECLRNRTHSGTLVVGADAWFGSIEPNKACWVSWTPVGDDNAAALERSARRAMPQGDGAGV